MGPIQTQVTRTPMELFSLLHMFQPAIRVQGGDYRNVGLVERCRQMCCILTLV
jgi:hypothetical protein